jgi:serine/threonine-protein kinase SRPK3
VVLASDRLAHLTEDEITDMFGDADPPYLERLDGKPIEEGMPRQEHMSVEWPALRPIFDDNLSIRILDFAASFRHDQPLAKPACAKGFGAPELYFADSYDFRIDLYSAGLLVGAARKPRICADL